MTRRSTTLQTSASPVTASIMIPKSLKACIVVLLAASTIASAASFPKPICKKSAILECEVKGDGSPEAALRQVDEHALMTMFCAVGCDHVINRAHIRPHATYVKPVCSVTKQETKVELKKFKQKDNRRSWTPWSQSQLVPRDIDDHTIKAATFRYCCMDQNGYDYTEAAANRIRLELSICKRLP